MANRIFLPCRGSGSVEWYVPEEGSPPPMPCTIRRDDGTVQSLNVDPAAWHRLVKAGHIAGYDVVPGNRE